MIIAIRISVCAIRLWAARIIYAINNADRNRGLKNEEIMVESIEYIRISKRKRISRESGLRGGVWVSRVLERIQHPDNFWNNVFNIRQNLVRTNSLSSIEYAVLSTFDFQAQTTN